MLKTLIATLFSGAALVGFHGAGAAADETFPNKPITLVVPSSAGGSHDLTARALSSIAEKHLGQPLIVELKPGGTGAVGSSIVASAKPDGYTLLFGGPDFNTTPPIMTGKDDFGPDGFAPVCRVNYTPMVFATRPDLPFKTFPELLDWAEANPGELSVAGARTTSGALFLTFVNKTRDIDFKAVPFEGGGATMMALLGGNVHVTTGVPAALAPHEAAGKMIFLVFTANERHKDYPDVPTARELGFDYEYVFWRSILAPKDTPPEIIEKMAGLCKEMAEDPDFLKIVGEWGDQANYLGPQEFHDWWRQEYEVQRELISTSN